MWHIKSQFKLSGFDLTVSGGYNETLGTMQSGTTKKGQGPWQ